MGQTTCGDLLSFGVQKKITGGSSDAFIVFHCFLLKRGRNVDPPNLSCFRVEVDVSSDDVLVFELDQLRHSGARRTKKADYEIPFVVPILPELVLEELVVGIADDVLKERLLLKLDELQLEIGFLDEFEILVDSLNS